MKVEYKDRDYTVFSNIDTGECFKYALDTYIKISYDMAFNFNTNESVEFDGRCQVYPKNFILKEI